VLESLGYGDVYWGNLCTETPANGQGKILAPAGFADHISARASGVCLKFCAFARMFGKDCRKPFTAPLRLFLKFVREVGVRNTGRSFTQYEPEGLIMFTMLKHFAKDIGIDLGTANTLVYVKDRKGDRHQRAVGRRHMIPGHGEARSGVGRRCQKRCCGRSAGPHSGHHPSAQGMA
jgi:hypothetical protein